MDLAISPEGGLVASCGLDGIVYFFQVEWEDGLLQASQMPDPWKPHEGRPVYRVLFLDDVRGVKKDVQFCCHAITCGEFNRELKLWRMDNWACLQTLQFASPAGERPPELKIACDSSGRYVVLTDSTRSVFYVAEFCSTDAGGGPALTCLTEFVIADPCIDFSIASLKPAKSTAALASTGAIGSGESAQTLHLQTVSPRALQNHFITFAPSFASGAAPSSPAAAASSGPASAAATPRSLGNSTDVDLLLASGSSAAGSGGFGRAGTAVDSSTVTIVTGLASPVGSSVVGSRDVAVAAVAASAAADAAADVDDAEPADDDAEVSQLMSQRATDAGDDAIDMPPPPPTNGDEEDDTNAIEPDEDDDEGDEEEEEEGQQDEGEAGGQQRDDLLILPDSPDDNDDNDRQSGRAGDNDEDDEDTEEDGCVEEDDERAAAVADLAAAAVAAAADSGGAGDRPSSAPKKSPVTNIASSNSALTAAVASAASSAAASAVGSAVGDLRQLAEASRLQSQQLAELQRQVAGQAAQLALLADQHRQAERQLRSDQQDTLAGIRQAALTSLDRLQQEVRDEVHREMSATNAAVQENITKFIRSKGTVDTIGKTTAQCVQGPLVNAYKDMCNNLLFPRLEQMSQELFTQLNTAFSAGLNELIAKVREETEAIAREQTLVKNKEISSLKAACTDVKSDLRSTAESIRKEVDNSLARLGEQQQQQQRQFLEQHQRLMQEQQQMFQQQMQQQMQQLFQQQQQQQQDTQQQQQQRLALRSTLVTPVPQKQQEQRRIEDYREAVNSALAMQDYNRAFKEALSSTRLELVLDLCNRVKPFDLFRSPNLEQQVILSLIQQLGRNLLERTKLKCDYLQESFDYLRPEESVVREHGKRVLQHLVKRIDELNCDPTDQFAYRTVRRVRMLATGFINEHLV
ncbi:hypothetical protein BOX15_Mlig021866g2 [Macrostomum lignano]|uniref:Uncharacterized protein n=1 Tax=Macrostomum lignano TaxID=282301 RepID=A0A267E0D2_9PLAT|nr:hypothetical protein BOX15_Mlig021866g2 [Macrostomum lignano]